ncbi:YlzJ-like family protein [Alicyclobacillus mali]|uniref:YlzJ-like family protein n=1 Tax=Alicyclobacillus mali (ex Roth et al. 2021) TaxID=1123961 RepID=A0ABS0F1I6_9BACL|nr:YlzJ-like family protein [Alicyclobacillus mali (ex Roth et al. 2021)]MBF8377173.1 YlzJ-like family protein [Alicyclobacillus mali (ex Roth et al. 2021)]MCL6488456.1 YlzJ-like family protein [Alicyclobacillus mali (ex Roth et al. 2021)]
MLWTTLAEGEIYSGWWSQSPRFEEWRDGHRTLIVTRDEYGTPRLVRLISPVASDYLRPEWQPGAALR